MRAFEKLIILCRLIVEWKILGNVNSLHDLGAWYASGDLGKKYLHKAFSCYKLGAEKGCRECQYDLAFMYLVGEGCNKDLEVALKWFTESANNGSKEAFDLANDIKAGLFDEVNKDNLAFGSKL